jgi:hypothetical protein
MRSFALGSLMSDEYKTTRGSLRWDDKALAIIDADDPFPPDGKGWMLVGSAVGALRSSEQPILWFWSRRRLKGWKGEMT